MTLKSIQKKSIKTSCLNISFLSAGNSKNQPLILIHGNVSSNLFWQDTIAEFSKHYWVIAPDLRGYGETESLPIDATRGLRNWSDDLKAFVKALNITQKLHMFGWSLGGGIVMQYAIDNPTDIASMTLISPISPFGFGGTKDIIGTPCYPNCAGSGGGAVNTEFIENLVNCERGEANPNTPRNVMNQFYFKPPFRTSKEREESFIDSMLSTKVAEGFYPGKYEACEEWPGILPGDYGINNAMSPKYMNLSPIVDITPKCPILWIRGENDIIVSDQSYYDMGFLGKQGCVEGWPGEDVFPPQPMVSQTRHVLEQYKEKGGKYKEVVINDAGHSPHIEKSDIFYTTVSEFLNSYSSITNNSSFNK